MTCETELRAVTSPEAPLPRGHYRQGVFAHSLLHVSAQLPIEPAGASVEDPLHLRSAPAEAQARRALQNVLAIVQAAGGAKESVVRLTFYITSVRHWAAVDRACREILGEHRTARSVVPVPELHLGFEVAVEGLASCPDARTAREELVAGRGPW
jgi:enamine deaminase RidA (YjgF/YER057c/UK114 family)